MLPLDIETIVAAEGKLRGWDARTMAHVYELAATVVDAEREACARVIEESQEPFSDGRDGQRRHLTPRSHGNLAGLAYADAIRRRSNR